MKQKLQRYTTAFMVLLGLFVVLAGPSIMVTSNVSAAETPEQALCRGSGGTPTSGGGCTTTNKRTVAGTIKQVNTILIFIVAAVAVIMIIVGGLRYVLSNGDSSATTGAKNTILYAVIGLIVASMAYAIVDFVTGNLERAR